MSARRHQQGYVFRKGNGWYLRYYDSVVSSDGTSARKAKCKKLIDYGGKYRSKSSVKALAEEFLRPFNDGTYTPVGGMSVRDFVERQYLPYVKQQKRPSTYDGYRKIWQAHLKSRMAMPLREFRTVDCETMLNQIARKNDMGIRTVAHIKHLLSGVFRYAIRTGALNGANPVRDVALPKAKPPSETHAYTLLEIAQIMEALPEPARTIVATAAFTGLRRGELKGLDIDDYLPEVVMVRRSVWKKSVDDPKGRRGKGAVPAIPFLEKILDRYVATYQPRKHLFEGARGGRVDLDYIVQSTILPALKGKQVTWHGWHACRRGLATNLHALGVPDIVIQAILRHSDVGVTRESYIKRNAVDPQSLAAMKTLEALVCNQNATANAPGESQIVAVN